MEQSNINIFSRLFFGYSRALLGLGQLLFFILGIAAVSFAFTYPLWYWALNFTSTYTFVVIALFAAALLYTLYKKAALSIGRKKSEGLSSIQIIKEPLLSIGRIVLFLVFLYLFASLVASSHLILAAIVAVAALFILGTLFFSR